VCVSFLSVFFLTLSIIFHVHVYLYIFSFTLLVIVWIIHFFCCLCFLSRSLLCLHHYLCRFSIISPQNHWELCHFYFSISNISQIIQRHLFFTNTTQNWNNYISSNARSLCHVLRIFFVSFFRLHSTSGFNNHSTLNLLRENFKIDFILKKV
jgi:hypothetical protein